MRVVTITCRECPPGKVSASFASEFEPNDETRIQDMQTHLDINFKARCDNCFACDWEVTDVKRVIKAYNSPVYI